MSVCEMKVEGTFSKVRGGYSYQVDKTSNIFVPDFCVSRFIPETGELYMSTPDYESIESSKTPAVLADKLGVYSWCYEMDRAPVDCDFSADLSYYGKHYYIKPLREGLPRLQGRGIKYDEKLNEYKVTMRAFDKLKLQYKISRKTYLD